MMQPTVGRFRIHRTTIDLASADAGFADFAREMLQHHVEGGAGADLEVGFGGYRLFTRRGAAAPGRGWAKLDAGLYQRGHEYWVGTPRFSMQVAIEGRAMTVQGSYRERFDHSFRRLTNPNIRPNNYQQVLRHLVLTPTFLLEEMHHGALPMHAGVVSNGRRGLVLLGLSGVGKSTLSLHLALQPGWRLVADNYALFDDEGVHGVREPARLSAEALALLGAARPELLAQPRSATFGNRLTLDIGDRYLESARVQDVLLVRLGEEFSLEEIAPAAMHGVMLRLANALKEFHYHNHLEMCYPVECEAPGQRCDRTRRFLEGKRSWVLTISRRESLAQTTDRMNDAIQFL
jgi:hypothetical protein